MKFLKISKAGIVLFSVLALASFASAFFYFNAKSELNDARAMLHEKESALQTVKVENEDLKFKLLKATTLPTKSINKVEPVKIKPKKKKPVIRKVKNRNYKKKQQVFYTSGINTGSPIVKLVVYESNGKTKTYTTNCYKEGKPKKNSVRKVRGNNSRQTIVRR